jgi:hypothetical protein
LSQRIEFNSLDEMKEKLENIQIGKGEYAHLHVEIDFRIMPEAYLIVPWLPFPKCKTVDEVKSVIEERIGLNADMLKAHGLELVNKNVVVSLKGYDRETGYCSYHADIDIYVRGASPGWAVALYLIAIAIIMIFGYLIADRVVGFLEKGGGDVLKQFFDTLKKMSPVFILLFVYLILREIKR